MLLMPQNIVLGMPAASTFLTLSFPHFCVYFDGQMWSFVEHKLMAEKTRAGYRLRIHFPEAGWLRFEKLANALGADEQTVVRMCASIGLAQLELTVFPNSGVEPTSESVGAALTASFTDAMSDVLARDDTTVKGKKKK
jgi:hypothetical protein